MLPHPRLKSVFAPTVLEPRTLFLMSEHLELVFEGEAFAALAGLLDGTRTVGEVLERASRRVPWQEAYAALAHLEQRGCLIEGTPVPEPGPSAFWDGLSVPAGRVRDLASTPFEVLALDGLPPEPISASMTRAGLRPGSGGLLVVAAPDYLATELAAVNASALAVRRPWVLLKPTGTLLLIGPLFRPGSSGCWDCLAHRLRHNRQLERHASRTARRRMPVAVTRGRTPSSYSLAASLAAGEIARSLLEDRGDGLEAALLSFDLGKRQLERHAFAKRPQCPACGDPRLGLRGPGPVPLVSRPKPQLPPGAERARSEPDGLEGLERHVSPISGIVTSLTACEQPEGGVTHSFVAGHYFPARDGDLTALRVNLVARSGGKGRTEGQARRGAVCEAIERTSGIAWGDEPRREATWAELAPEAVPLRQLLQFSERQYLDRERFNAGNDSDYHEVPPPPDEDARISWSAAWSLTHRRVRWLPTAYCFYGFVDPGSFFTRADSNGCAAGPTLEEAVLSGLLELVERDAVALWWYNRLRRPEVDAESFGLERFVELRAFYADVLDRELHVLDLTSDLGIPTIAVVSRCLGRRVEDVVLGFAAHLDPVVALAKALEEANQYLPAVQRRAPDGATAYRLATPETVRWWKTATYENQPYLVPDPSLPVRRLADLPSLATPDFAADVEVLVEAARRRGLEVLVVDQTRPDVGLPVARVVVPGLRHFWRRLAPGRLYDVPVELGWMEKPHSEEE
ncbi:TOMM precursor leader peptide-binding protein, partial [Acidobacteria bacterium ACD]|nr:TOMM precursor leader peptide-binding protein [Acidobacteria bacterium ACD]